MSKIRVQEIEHTASTNTNPAIALNANNNVTFDAGVTATSFTGDGANLTNVPAPSTFNAANLTGSLPAIDGSALTSLSSANLTGSLPAIDGSALTGIGGGGGALEFVSKTPITVSDTTTQINFTGLDHGFVYKVICKIGLMSGTGNPLIYFYYDDGSNNVSNLGIIDYVGADPGSQQRWSDAQSYVQVYTYGYEANNWEYEMDFHTGYYGWFRGTGHPNGGNSYAAGHGTFWGHLDPNNYATKRIAGISLRHSNSRTFQSGSEVLLYKFKES
tara:strand:+ start:785 stop:1600 length:816 start_codon:yes stop_codon:yes gene_type:complete